MANDFVDSADNRNKSKTSFGDSPATLLPIIVLAQFAGTSVWFASNAVLADIGKLHNLPSSALGTLSSSVQFGFILGTLAFALLNISDKYSPSKVFFASALLAAASNLVMLWADTFPLMMLLRSLTGFCLAGIYPVGMKIAADHHEKGLGKALGFLVGALVVGTAFPHLLRSIPELLHWKAVIVSTSVLAALGGWSIFLWVPDGPHRKPASKLDLKAIFRVFKAKDFRSAAFGYFGHMWELYSFWVFLPVVLSTYAELHNTHFNIALASFLIIFAGFPACVFGGYLSQSIGSLKTAQIALAISLGCCLFSPLSFALPFPVFLGFLVVWAMAVIADSPQFSTLVAHAALPEVKGSALTFVNCIGFSITILSILMITWLRDFVPGSYLYLFLAPGPFLALLSMRKTGRF